MHSSTTSRSHAKKKKSHTTFQILLICLFCHAIKKNCWISELRCQTTRFFYKQHQAETGKKVKQKLSKIHRLIFFYLKVIHFLCSCSHPFIRSLKWDWKWKMDHRYNISRTRSRRRHKYTKCKMCLSMIIFMCNKQHLSNISSWIHGTLKQHWI